MEETIEDEPVRRGEGPGRGFAVGAHPFLLPSPAPFSFRPPGALYTIPLRFRRTHSAVSRTSTAIRKAE